MELYEARDHYIIQDGNNSLWCNRFDGGMFAGTAMDLCSAWNPVCLGRIYGVIGKFRILPDDDWRLILIRNQSHIGTLPCGHPVYKVTRVVLLPLSINECTDLDIELCKKHHFGMRKTDKINSSDAQQKALQKTWNQIKSAAENVKPKKKEMREKEKFEKRVLEEIYKMFHDLDSYYYSRTGDLTNTTQRQHSPQYDASLPLWKRADKRFFWNQHMLQDLITKEDPLADHWIIPVIQGYVQMEQSKLHFDLKGSFLKPKVVSKDPVEFTLGLISRRSWHRAGTRSRRRGVDSGGHCANYVETEQIIATHDNKQPHTVAFVQVRGSVPVFWSQSGIKYRPPPRLDKGEKETQEAFEKHFTEELSIYKKVHIISLVELVGREKIISDAFFNHVLEYNSPDLSYITFDFHEYCRGMRFENVSLLLEGIRDIIKDMRYCWVDRKGMICDQQGIFRINCVDCLDRTNVVQTAIARVVMETQCRKLGLLPPDENLPRSCRMTFQQMWANNGDAISRQYAGTVALKGDYTRTGERRLAGLMKDGANSVNRYYLRFKDVYRQASIDITLGNPVVEELNFLKAQKPQDEVDGEEDSLWMQEQEENMKQLITDCKKMLIVEPETCLGGWGVIDCDISPGDPTQEMDTIILLSQRAYYIVSFDEEMEKISQCHKVGLENLEKIEIGPEPAVFKSKYSCIRIFYGFKGQTGFFHTFRATNTRLFNNIVIMIKNQEEAKESLRAIAESINAASKLHYDEVPICETKLERKKSRPHPHCMNIMSQLANLDWCECKLSISRESSTGDVRAAAASNQPSTTMASVQRTLNIINPIRRMRMIGRPTSADKKREAVVPESGKDAPDAMDHSPSEYTPSDNQSEASDLYLDLTDDEILAVSSVAFQDFPEDDLGIHGYRDGKDDEDEVVLHSCGIIAAPHGSQLTSGYLNRSLDKDEDAHNVVEGELQFVEDHFSNQPVSRKRVDKKSKLTEHYKRHSVEMMRFAERLGKEMSLDFKTDIDSPDTIAKISEETHIVSDSGDAKNTANIGGDANICGEMLGVPNTKEKRPSQTFEVVDDESGFYVLPDQPEFLKDTTLVPPQSDKGGPDGIAVSLSTGVLKSDKATIVAGEADDEFIKEPVLPESCEKRLVKLGHSNMKTSFSDGSISYHTESEEISLNPAKQEFSLGKLRVQMPKISLPNFQGQRAQRQQRVDDDIEEIKRLKMGQRPCQTRIMNINEEYVANLAHDVNDISFM
ncbi:phosphatidylinositide phosphatase SAC2-like isoform X2 [Lineus longissimus]|uniref:phosphatidylinositide phosphatase SAC2-like isoform X2 n=1 Tax=Lineus longissimus TaxID=88925 RepID=UPI00315C7146